MIYAENFSLIVVKLSHILYSMEKITFSPYSLRYIRRENRIRQEIKKNRRTFIIYIYIYIYIYMWDFDTLQL